MPNYKDGITHLKSGPNFYKFFPLSRENHGFNFVIHSSAFRIKTDRTQFEEDIDGTNTSIFEVFWNYFHNCLSKIKNENRNEFLQIYSNLLISKPLLDDNGEEKWFYDSFYKPLVNYLKNNIPTKNGFSNNANNVKIKNLKLQLNLSDLGLNGIEWFEWNEESDKLLINEATKEEKLGIEEWDIRDIVENADLDNINNWIANYDEETYIFFLEELEASNLRLKTKEKIRQIKLFLFNDGKFLSLNEISYNPKIYKFSNEIVKLGFGMPVIDISKYQNICSSATNKSDKEIFSILSEKCIENSLTAEEKKMLFLNLMNFDNVGQASLKELHLFSNNKSDIKPLNELIDFTINTPAWLNTYKIKEKEYFSELKNYLVPKEELFNKIILPNIENIKNELTDVKDIRELVNFFNENQRGFFDEYIIQKKDNSYLIIDKLDKYQIEPPNEETRVFIETHLSNSLIILPSEFSDFYGEDNIIKRSELHSLIFELVDFNEHKEVLVDIIEYNAINKFINKLSELRFNFETEYSIDSYEYKILYLACEFVSEPQDILELRKKVIISSNGYDYKLSEISLNTDKIKILGKEFRLSEILPSSNHNNNFISDFTTKFVQLGISSDKLSTVLGINEEINLEDVYSKYCMLDNKLENAEQLLFISYYQRYKSNDDFFNNEYDHLIYDYVYPSDFALETEKLPKYVIEWIRLGEIKISDLEIMGVYTENSALVSLRKFFLEKIDFNISIIAQDEKLSGGRLLLKTFKFLKEREITLETEDEFAIFKEMVRVINVNRKKGQELIIQEHFDFEALKLNSKEWKSIGEFSVYLYNGVLPKIVKLDKNDDYIFYHYNDCDYAVNGNNIYINENIDTKKTLQKIASDDENSFSFEDLWALFEGNKGAPTQFLEEVNKFISDLEITEWKDYVPELKNLIQDLSNHPKNKQKLFNLVAKIKLTKKKGEKFEDSDEGFNAVKVGNEKYFVHSARGAFAYIHPNEILKMRNEHYKMALDFGEKFKIYNSAEEILKLNTNHILAYQHKKTMEELYTFCEANRGANKHLLIIDKNNSGEKSRELLKLLNLEDDYQ